jgi:hypothetical protein
MSAILLALLGVACMDSEGNRITLQQWWKSRSGPDRSEAAARTSRDSATQTNDKVASSSREGSQGGSDQTEMEPSAASLNEPGAAAPSRDPSPQAIRSEGLIVDNETIRVEDILEPLQSRLPEMAAELPPEVYWRRVGELVRQQIIEAVAQHLIWRKARQMVKDEVQAQLDKSVDKMEKDRINREFGGRETAYERYLAKHGKTRDEVRDRLRRSILIDSYLRDRLLPLVPQPRRSELLEYFNDHLADFSSPSRREMYLIDVPVAAFLDLRRPVTRDHERAATEKARTLINEAAQALRGGMAFVDAARKYSHGLHKDEGGYWGFITEAPKGQTAPLLGHWEAPSRVLFELPAGGTSDVIEAARSFFIVHVGKIEGGEKKTFQEAQPEIATQLRQQRFQKLRAEFLQRELDSATIGSLDDFVRAVLDAVPTRQGAVPSAELPDSEVAPSRSPPLKTDAKKAMRP